MLRKYLNGIKIVHFVHSGNYRYYIVTSNGEIMSIFAVKRRESKYHFGPA
jgi:hypothetical protein